ncbi:MAG: hypothetical protein PF904_00275 [Kiritimatiellae bacterium]|jgi:hypothetical protein|nr:hypothetical protein [Kiritimatiellia bacterium]
MKLRDIPEKYFEWAGIGIGFVGPVIITLQIRAELASTTPSTLSFGYLSGYLVIFFFWFLYGLRFGRIAVWFGNALGIILQTILIGIVLFSS